MNFYIQEETVVSISQLQMKCRRFFLEPLDLILFFTSVVQKNPLWAPNIIFRQDGFFINANQIALENCTQLLNALNISCQPSSQSICKLNH